MLVDEYQDTNRAQYVLVNLLGAAHAICASWATRTSAFTGSAGADIRNILDFERDYPDAGSIAGAELPLDQRILEAANGVIATKSDRPDKGLWTDNRRRPLIVFTGPTTNGKRRRSWPTRSSGCGGRKAQYGDVALLYRTHAQSRAFEEDVHPPGHPVPHRGGHPLLRAQEIKDVLASCGSSPTRDAFSLRRIVNVPGGASATLPWPASRVGGVNGIPLYEAHRDCRT